MIRHVNAVIAVDCHKQAGDDKGGRVLLCTPVLHYVREHRQGEHHAGNGHVSAGPAFEIIIAACQVRNHLPPVPVFRSGILQGDQILVAWAGCSLLEPQVHIIRRYSGNQDGCANRNEFIRVRMIQKPDHYERHPGIQHNPEQPAQHGKEGIAFAGCVSEQSADSFAVIAVGVIDRHKASQQQKHPGQQTEPVALCFQPDVQACAGSRIEAVGEIRSVGFSGNDVWAACRCAGNDSRG